MTINQLLKLPTETLAEMTDEQLKEHLAPYIHERRLAVGIDHKTTGPKAPNKALSKSQISALLKQAQSVFGNLPSSK